MPSFTKQQQRPWKNSHPTGHIIWLGENGALGEVGSGVVGTGVESVDVSGLVGVDCGVDGTVVGLGVVTACVTVFRTVQAVVVGVSAEEGTVKKTIKASILHDVKPSVQDSEG